MSEKLNSSIFEKKYKINNYKRFGAAVLTLVVSTSIAAHGIIDKYSEGPKFSTETTTFTAEPNDGILDAAYEVKNNGVDIREIAYHIENMPENKEALSDGILQVDETITIPESVEKP